MEEAKRYSAESPAAQAHLTMLQSAIHRMATNSAACKTWSITLVSATLVLIADKGVPGCFAVIAAVPAVLFLALDTYYLALELGFRRSHDDFIDRLHHAMVVPANLYAVSVTGSIPRLFWRSLRSFAIWPFYLALGVLIALTAWLVL